MGGRQREVGVLWFAHSSGGYVRGVEHRCLKQVAWCPVSMRREQGEPVSWWNSLLSSAIPSIGYGDTRFKHFNDRDQWVFGFISFWAKINASCSDCLVSLRSWYAAVRPRIFGVDGGFVGSSG